jgi:hypothetical protein
MRYFVVTYYQKPITRSRPQGGYDENVEVSRRLRTKDIQCASVILDFKEMQVVKCTISGEIGSREWNTVHDYYLQHYKHVFERLHQENGREMIIDTDKAEEHLPEPDSHKTPHADPTSVVES